MSDNVVFVVPGDAVELLAAMPREKVIDELKSGLFDSYLFGMFGRLEESDDEDALMSAAYEALTAAAADLVSSSWPLLTVKGVSFYTISADRVTEEVAMLQALTDLLGD